MATKKTVRKRATKRTRVNPLDAPVVAGSGLTQGALAKQAQTASETVYGPAERQAQGIARDTPGYYDQYINELKAHSAIAAQYGAGAVAQMGALGQGVLGFDQQQAAGQQQAAQADAATRGGTVDPGLTGMASNASTARQALLASFGQQQASVNAATNVATDAKARVVAPGQKLQAIAGAAGKVSDLQRQKGAYNQKYRDQAVADELKNVLAGQALGLNTAKVKLGAQESAAKLKQSGAALAETAQYHQGQLSVAQQNANTAATKAAATAAAKGKPKRLSAQQHSATRDQLDRTSALIKKLSSSPVPKAVTDKQGNPVIDPATGAQKKEMVRLTSQQIRAVLLQGGKGVQKVPKELINAAYDLAKLGHLSPANVRALHNRGLSIKQLGYQTGAAPKKKTVKKQPLSSVAGSLFGGRG